MSEEECCTCCVPRPAHRRWLEMAVHPARSRRRWRPQLRAHRCEDGARRPRRRPVAATRRRSTSCCGRRRPAAHGRLYQAQRDTVPRAVAAISVLGFLAPVPPMRRRRHGKVDRSAARGSGPTSRLRIEVRPCGSSGHLATCYGNPFRSGLVHPDRRRPDRTGDPGTPERLELRAPTRVQWASPRHAVAHGRPTALRDVRSA